MQITSGASSHSQKSHLSAKESPLLFTGGGSMFTHHLRQQVRLYVAGYRIFNLDCAIRFHIFHLVEEAQRLCIPVDPMLQSIQIQRAFTPYQILDALHDQFRSTSEDRSLLYILSPLKQFFDGDVAHDEAAYMLRYLIRTLHRLTQSGRQIIVMEQENYPHPLFTQAMAGLQQMCQVNHKRGQLREKRRLFRHAGIR